ncbi:dehydrogenase with different specificitie [Aspergillus affinis]|uniref:dehydrogenase with different specificitie n=1 Tax=Aspergillus affinis TaxID=1070780 RepID=UPI0022FE8273|nr:dehydrogenase with different specificitie [Aspergillus affinis]KAI9042788.1 dehydrogenase with different specificitie [Aspergillus affinis]
MQEYHLDASILTQAATKTIIITGAANGIGAATATLFNARGANVVISDLEPCREKAKSLIQSFDHPDRAVFISADILNWTDMTTLFKQAAQKFGLVDIVIANAGTMESSPVLDLNDVDGEGNLRESAEGFRVIDINLKGTLNTSTTSRLITEEKALRLAMHHMKSNRTPGSIVLLASTSGHFGGTGVAAYVASKHGVIGLLRASQQTAEKHRIRVNAVAPFFTPTHITAGFAQKWKEAGLDANTPQGVAEAIANIAVDEGVRGECILVAGKYLRQMESTRARLLPDWLGQDVAAFMGRAMQFFVDIGGYVLPQWRS